MNFEPQKLFIGLVDFFSILMPGSMLAYLTKDWAVRQLSLGPNYPLKDAETVLVFLFASYLLGHFIFLVSAALLDDWLYDPLRNLTESGQRSRRLVKGKALSPHWLRSLANSNWFFGKDADSALTQALRIKARALSKVSVDEIAINAFQWSKTTLTKELPDGLLSVQRFEADSKFFRSFAFVLGILAALYVIQLNWAVAAICLGGIILALWRYIDQRFKATQQAYWFIITLEAKKEGTQKAEKRPDGLTHAGGIVYRQKDGETEFLLITADKERSQWVLPKGHIEPGEAPRVTAVREIREETGHWARVVKWLEDAPLSRKPNAPMVRWFLMELVEELSMWPEENRRRKWIPHSEAAASATFQETKKLIGKADLLCNQIGESD